MLGAEQSPRNIIIGRHIIIVSSLLAHCPLVRHPQMKWIPCFCLQVFSCIPQASRRNKVTKGQHFGIIQISRNGHDRHCRSLLLPQLPPVMNGNTLKELQSREDDILVVVVHFAVQQFIVWGCTNETHRTLNLRCTQQCLTSSTRTGSITTGLWIQQAHTCNLQLLQLTIIAQKHLSHEKCG